MAKSDWSIEHINVAKEEEEVEGDRSEWWTTAKSNAGVAIAAFFNALPTRLLRSNRFNLRPPLQMSRIRIPFRAASLRDWKHGFHVGTHCCLTIASMFSRMPDSFCPRPRQTHRALTKTRFY